MNEFDDLPEPTKEQWEEWEKQQGSVPRYSLVVDTPDHADSVEMEKQNWGGDWVRYPDHAAALQSKDAEIERIGEEYGQIALNWVARMNERDAEIERLKEDLTLTRGAMDAQDQREREAGERCGVSWLEVGCDWPDWVADEVLSLRAKIERLKKDNSGLHEVQDEQRRIITSLRAELATARAEAQRNADAAEALAGLERLGGNYALSFNTVNQKWDVMFWLGLNVWEINQDRPTYLAAVRAAEQAKGEEA